MAAPMVLDSTTVQPTETQGLPAADDKIVRELDVYLLKEPVVADAQTYLLQFPLRPPWRPYHTHHEGLENVKLKPKVKKLQADVPLDTTSRNYNDNVEPSRKIKSITLDSARLEQRTSFAAGFVDGDRLLLFPIDQALQLRPSLAYLDKEKAAGAASKKQKDGEAEEEQKPELMQLTVQVKRRETEQQAEARLRSYAHLAAVEEADPWVPLAFHGEASDTAHGVWDALVAKGAKTRAAAAMSREQYLEAIVPGSSTLHTPAAPIWEAPGASRDLGRPAAALGGGGGDVQPQAEAAVAAELHPAIVGVALVLLKQAQVANIEAIRIMLEKQQDAQLKATAATASDAALHAAVVSSGEITHLRKSYFPTRLGNAALDPLRTVVVELLKGQEQLRRSDIFEAARAKGLAVSDTLYSKVVKELCTSRGSIWALKGGP